MKKAICLLLVCAMLLPISPAVAADDSSAKPTVEEILSGYHQKSFDKSREEHTGTSTYARTTGEGKNLEQETVEELRAAGYEAYLINANSYTDVQNALNTDLTAMGISPDAGDFIIVISGEDEPAAKQTRGSDLTLPPHVDDSSNNTFNYSYNGYIYKMRYATVVGTADNGLTRKSTTVIENRDWPAEAVNNLFNTAIVALVDSASEPVSIGTLASFFLDIPEEYTTLNVKPNSVNVEAITQWTCQYIQIWNANDQKWEAAQFSEYATTTVYWDGFVLNTETKRYEGVKSPDKYTTKYSYWYNNVSKRKELAVIAYNEYRIASDSVAVVEFYLCDIVDLSVNNYPSSAFIRQYRPTALVLP